MEYFKYESALLVDDSYVDGLIHRKMLQTNVFARNIVLIDCPEKAISYLRKCVQHREVPNVIFIDIRMPEMDGFQFIECLNEIDGIHLSDLKIYILSSSLDPADFKRISQDGRISKFINKPLTERVLNEIG